MCSDVQGGKCPPRPPGLRPAGEETRRPATSSDLSVRIYKTGAGWGPRRSPSPTRGSLGDDLRDQTCDPREAGAGLGPGSRFPVPRPLCPPEGWQLTGTAAAGAEPASLWVSCRIHSLRPHGRSHGQAEGLLPLPPLPVPPGVSAVGRPASLGGPSASSAHRVKCSSCGSHRHPHGHPWTSACRVSGSPEARSG